MSKRQSKKLLDIVDPVDENRPGDPVDDDRVFEFDSPESSTVIHADYDHDTRRLVVQFKGGARYRYTIGEEMWDEFVLAESKGGFFAARIRPFYLGEKL